MTTDTMRRIRQRQRSRRPVQHMFQRNHVAKLMGVPKLRSLKSAELASGDAFPLPTTEIGTRLCEAMRGFAEQATLMQQHRLVRSIQTVEQAVSLLKGMNEQDGTQDA